MPVSDIYSGNALVQPKSIQDFNNDNMLMQGKRQALQSGALALQESQMNLQKNQNILAQRNALTQAIQSGDIDLSNPDHAPRALALAPDVAGGMLKSIGDYQKDQAQVGKDKGAGNKSNADATDQALQTYRSLIPMARTPQQFGTWVDGLFSNPNTAQLAKQFGTAESVKASIPQDPAAFEQYKQQNAMGMDKFIADQTQRRGQDVSSQTQLTTNAATNSAHIQAAGIAASTSRQNNAANINKDYAIAGLGPDGKASSDGGGLLDPASIANAAARYNIDGTLPPNLGRGQQGPREIASILKEASAQAAARGDTPEAQRIAQLANKANASALGKLTTQQTMVGAFEKNFTKNADIALELSAKNSRTGMPIVNAWVNAGKRAVTGDADLAAFDVSVKATVNEYAKIVSGGSGGGATAQGEIGKIEGLLSSAQNTQQVTAVLNLMKRETANRMQAFEDQKSELSNSMSRNKPNPAPAPPAAPPAAAPAASGWKYIGPAK